ncbi:hypothetical protein BD324DRAFT_637677 [Kockovaella imperatae]|uniref:K Homology domain-containing protein n=1 Tax=Kockovaella imperatae TaxID=4999 RepID=A0A1Y1U8N5_9TREE|nr:hypothetical protein BD324DRAFT_637677 [Kockovaella imperatae]ORX33904.1 hypothetical protein BD324DRAFT_637677 [Kockovaella imperatae]
MDSSERKRKWDEPAGDTAPDARTSAAPSGSSDAAAQAAAIAAKIAASLRGPPGAQGHELVKSENKDEGFVKDIEINDLRNRYVLTKGSTQKQIGDETGASIVTKGVWVPDTTKLQPGETPLYLHIVAPSQIILNAAVEKINELINQELGPLIDERTLVARNRALGLPPPESLVKRNERVKWPEAKLFIGLESLRNFNVRAKTVGPGGMFVKYIQAETGARVQIKGIGSGFMEAETGREAEEPMHINIAAPNDEQVERARVLADDLLAVLRIEYEKARTGGNSGGGYGGGYGGYQQGSVDPYAGYYQNGQGTPGDGSQAGATPAAGSATPGQLPQQGTEAWTQYAAYWAAYGYDVNDPQFQAWQASQYGQQQGGAGASAGATGTPAASS